MGNEACDLTDADRVLATIFCNLTGHDNAATRRHINESSIQRFGTNIVKKDVHAIRARRRNRGFEWRLGLIINRIVKTQST